MTQNKKMLIVGMVISIIFVVVGSMFLSLSAETLDEVAEKFGASELTLWNPPIPDYSITGLEESWGLNVAIGVVFSLLVFGVLYLLGKALVARE